MVAASKYSLMAHCTYDAEARALALKLGQRVLVRDDKQLYVGLEIPKYFGFYLFTHWKSSELLIKPMPICVLTSTGLEMLYTREGEGKEIQEILELLSRKYPKTYEHLQEEYKWPRRQSIKRGLKQNLNVMCTRSKLIEKSGAGYKILDEVRRTRLIPDVLVRNVG